MRWIQGFINPRIVNLPKYPSNWKSLIVLLYGTFLYVAFTLKINFYHNVFFGLAWCKMLECCIRRTFTSCEVNITERYQGCQLIRKDIIWNHTIIYTITQLLITIYYFIIFVVLDINCDIVMSSTLLLLLLLFINVLISNF